MKTNISSAVCVVIFLMPCFCHGAHLPAAMIAKTLIKNVRVDVSDIKHEFKKALHQEEWDYAEFLWGHAKERNQLQHFTEEHLEQCLGCMDEVKVPEFILNIIAEIKHLIKSIKNALHHKHQIK